MISVIVPAFNVESYIERCIQSVVNQTYRDWELLLVDDGSTDQTAQICRKWAMTDPRIRYYHQHRSGQGIARNYGVQMAEGDYIFFLDSDDWIRNDTLSCLYHYAKAEDLDIVFFDYMTVTRDGGGDILYVRTKLPIRLDGISNSRQTPLLLARLGGAVWDKFYKKSLLEGICQAGHPYEDSAILPCIVSRAQRIGQIQDAFYYYWSIRDDSTVNRSDTVFYIKNGLEEIINAFYHTENWELYQEALRGYSEWMLLVARNHVDRVTGKGRKEQRYAAFLQECQELLDQYYVNEKAMRSCQIAVWGSYNLRSTVNRCRRDLQPPRYHFGFSCITSLMAPRTGEVIERERHANGFREQMIQMDIAQKFRNLSEEEYKGIDIVCMDLLEERFLPVENSGNIVTGSDALSEITDANERIFESDYLASEEWKESADRFMDFLKQRFGGKLIILAENYLCEAKGCYEPEEYYPELSDIRKTNELLRECYRYLEEQYGDGLRVVKNHNALLEYTDVDYPHGCYPWHQNEYLYHEMAYKIEKMILQYIKGWKG